MLEIETAPWKFGHFCEIFLHSVLQQKHLCFSPNEGKLILHKKYSETNHKDGLNPSAMPPGFKRSKYFITTQRSEHG